MWQQILNKISSSHSSVTRLGNLLHFRQLFKACGNNYFAQFCPYFKVIFVKVSKSFNFLVKSILGNFYRYLATFYWSRWSSAKINSVNFDAQKTLLSKFSFWSWCYKTFLQEIQISQKIKKLKKVCSNVRTFTKMWKQFYF